MCCSYEGISLPISFLVISLIAFSQISSNVLLLEENVKRDSPDNTLIYIHSLNKQDQFSEQGISGV